MQTITIKGLVAAAKWVREKLKSGIEAEHFDDFRRSVVRTVADVERMCANHRVTPSQLPAVSYQAYMFLKTLDLTNLPVRAEAAETAEPEAGRVRIKNLLRICNQVQADINRIVEMSPPPAHTVIIDHPDVVRVLNALASNADIVERICTDAKTSPAMLSTPSRQAYQWFRYLSDPDNLAAHLTTIGAFRQVLDEPVWIERLHGRKVHIEMYYSSVLYRVDSQAAIITFTASQGFSGAPSQVIEALLRAALVPGQTAAKSEAQSYSDSDDFLEIIAELASLAEQLAQHQRGQHYDLNGVFDRVNALYFRGQVQRPRLTWSTMHTARKMGHYQPHTDTVMTSMTLDDARVPPFVIEFVMYHELLHKQLGAQLVNGRRYSHTAAFRTAERRYPQYQEAVDFIQALSQTRSQ